MALSSHSWRAAFFALLVPAVLIAGLAAFALTDELPAREARSQSHPTGLFVLMGGSFLLLYALQRSSFDFFSDPTSLCAWGGAVDALHHDAVDVVVEEGPGVALVSLPARRNTAWWPRFMPWLPS